VVEPSGALTIAAVRFRRDRVGAPDGPVVAVVSGGNVDPDAYLRYLATPIPA
jgi:threonine dehydratase